MTAHQCDIEIQILNMLNCVHRISKGQSVEVVVLERRRKFFYGELVGMDNEDSWRVHG